MKMKNKLQNLNLGQPMEMTQIDVNKDVVGVINNTKKGFVFSFQYYNVEKPEDQEVKELLLSTEDSLDREDLNNMNELLQEYRLIFKGYGVFTNDKKHALS